MALSKEERRRKLQEQMDALDKEPDAPRGNMSFTLDLGNDAAVERAIKYGLLPGDDSGDSDGDGDGDGDGEGKQADRKPNRRGFFGDE